MFNLSPFEIGLIALVVILLFGAKRLPELARSLGSSMKEFKKATQEVQKDFDQAINEPAPAPRAPAPAPTAAPAPAPSEAPKA